MGWSSPATPLLDLGDLGNSSYLPLNITMFVFLSFCLPIPGYCLSFPGLCSFFCVEVSLPNLALRLPGRVPIRSPAPPPAPTPLASLLESEVPRLYRAVGGVSGYAPVGSRHTVGLVCQPKRPLPYPSSSWLRLLSALSSQPLGGTNELSAITVPW